jgi:hypothetical protein
MRVQHTVNCIRRETPNGSTHEATLAMNVAKEEEQKEIYDACV